MNYHIRDPAVGVRQHGSLESLLIDICHRFAFQEIQAVHVFRIVADEEILLRLIKQNNRFKQGTAALLDVLAHGVKIRGEDNGSREQALVVFALALTEELLPPLVHHGEGRLIADKNFNLLALAVKDIADRSIAIAVILLQIRVGKILLCLTRTGHESRDIGAGNGDRQEADCRQNRITAADFIRHDESFIAFLGGQLLERALGLVCCAVNAASGALFAVFLFQHFAQHTERNGRLRGGAGLGDHVDRHITAFADFQQLGQSRGADAVAGEVNVGRILLEGIVIGRLQEFNRSAGTEVRPADADHDEYIGIRLDLFCRRLDAGKFFLIIISGKRNPTDKIISQTGTAVQCFMRRANLRGNRLEFIFADKARKMFRVHMNCHFCSSLLFPERRCVPQRKTLEPESLYDYFTINECYLQGKEHNLKKIHFPTVSQA